jgi:hypothetical protein
MLQGVFGSKVEIVAFEQCLHQMGQLTLESSMTIFDDFGLELIHFLKKVPDFRALNVSTKLFCTN